MKAAKLQPVIIILTACVVAVALVIGTIYFASNADKRNSTEDNESIETPAELAMAIQSSHGNCAGISFLNVAADSDGADLTLEEIKALDGLDFLTCGLNTLNYEFDDGPAVYGIFIENQNVLDEFSSDPASFLSSGPSILSSEVHGGSGTAICGPNWALVATDDEPEAIRWVEDRHANGFPGEMIQF